MAIRGANLGKISLPRNTARQKCGARRISVITEKYFRSNAAKFPQARNNISAITPPPVEPSLLWRLCHKPA